MRPGRDNREIFHAVLLQYPCFVQGIEASTQTLRMTMTCCRAADDRQHYRDKHNAGLRCIVQEPQ